MLAATTCTRRALSSLTGKVAAYSTVASSVQVGTAKNGVKVASIEDAHGAAGISLVVRGGARSENVSGAAHYLKNYGFKNNSKRTAFRITREAELAGGVLSANLTRETIAYSAEFLNADAALFAELVGDVVSHQKFQAHEHVDVANQVALEASQVTPAAAAIEAVHQAAFRTGLGRSVFASTSSKVAHADVVAYAAELFKTGNLALIGSGIPVDAVAEFADAFIQVPTGSSSSSSSSADVSTYFGGEVRTQANTNEYALAFQGAASANTAEFAALQVLKFALDESLTGAKAFNFGYTDAGLFGVLASGASATEVASAVSAAAEQLKAAAKSGLSEQTFSKALAQAKFAAATDGLTTRLDRLETIGAQVLLNGKYASISEALNKVSAADVAKVAKKVLGGKVSAAASGDLYRLPYADSLSL